MLALPTIENPNLYANITLIAEGLGKILQMLEAAGTLDKTSSS